MQSIDEAAAAVIVAVDALKVELKGVDLVKRAVLNLKSVVSATAPCCQAKHPGEPTFTLVGRDKLAVQTISQWLYLAEQQGAGTLPEEDEGRPMNPTKFDDAVDKLEEFKKWRVENPDKMKIPD